ncbi:pyridoxine/pyridoxamine 5'-phosphate oxidase-like isoform X2 [Harmonia axyridis]|uniref:pyridoxine/pyridoxamine 5'-phosphate oxidase-like isoform X2 n=1 Tax=Harmonia axyridis TaxID=115357 RepID=UPI001E277FB7|nr:pyridoxine/pyridoxamine 5'-phosphate oxidase-like isoform X2 [Harmonia axyridis]XP_045465416.1 pyridoxine/pyridoxamine 5'-phosphate oxidase-like isoform X2 [Harmonia axyridis]
MSLTDIRAAYQSRENVITDEKLSKIKEPIQLLDEWFELAKNHPNILEPHAVCLATATKNGLPSARFVLCKSHSKDGFTVFTHYTSRKGQDLEENPNCALTYYWEPFNRSIRIEGIAEKLPLSVADDYFKKRPYDSKIGALCSDQSKPIRSRNTLMEKEIELKEKYPDTTKVPRPPQWGGYLIKPHTMEFWQGQTDRIHDRIRFRKLKDGEAIDETISHMVEDGWYWERLAP